MRSGIAKAGSAGLTSVYLPEKAELGDAPRRVVGPVQLRSCRGSNRGAHVACRGGYK